MKIRSFLLLTLPVIAACASNSTQPETIDPTLTAIQSQVFDRSCSCHTVLHQAQLDLSAGKSYAQLVSKAVENDAARKRMTFRVSPGNPDSSFLYAKITGAVRTDEGDQMPKDSKISQAAIDAIRTWIANGAKND